MPNTRVKICGLATRDAMLTAVEAGAAYIGLNFFPKSPRYLEIEAARNLALDIPPGVAKVALTVDADEAFLDQIVETVPLDMLQLQGRETPERVAEIRSRYGLPVMKAIGIAGEEELAAIETYSTVADQLLIDAKPPSGAPLPGGNGIPFDWRLIANRRWSLPWMLAGGLTADNVAEAIALTGAKQVDVSSGVESAPGVKDPDRIRAFLKAAE